MPTATPAPPAPTLPEGARLTPSGTVFISGVGDTGVAPSGQVISPRAAAQGGRLEAAEAAGIVIDVGGKAAAQAIRTAAAEEVTVGGSYAFTTPPGGIDWGKPATAEQIVASGGAGLTEEQLAVAQALVAEGKGGETLIPSPVIPPPGAFALGGAYGKGGTAEGAASPEYKAAVLGYHETMKGAGEAYDEALAGLKTGEELTITKPEYLAEMETEFKRSPVAVFKPDVKYLTALYTLRGGGYMVGSSITTEGVEQAVSDLGAKSATATLREAGFENPEKLVADATQRLEIKRTYSDFIDKDGSLDLVALVENYKGNVPDRVLKELEGIGYVGIDKADLAEIAFWVTATPKQQFDKLVEQGDIPKYSTFIGVNKKGEIEYQAPPFDPEDIDKIKGRADDYLKDSWYWQRRAMLQAGLELPKSIWSEKQQRELAKYDKPVTLGYTAYNPHELIVPTGFKEFWNGLSESERTRALAFYETKAQRTKEAAEGLLGYVPIAGTIYFWDKMSVPEQIASVLFDIAIIGMVAAPRLGMVRGLKYAVPRTKGATKAIAALIYKPTGKTIAALTWKGKTGKSIIQVAKQAGQAHLRIEKALNTLRLTKKIPGLKLDQRMRSTLTKAVNQSKAADEKFAKMLYGLDAIDPSDLKMLEKLTKLRGLQRVVLNINKAQRNLTRAWAKLDADIAKGRLRAGTRYQAGSAAWMKRLGGIEELKTALDRALVRFGEVTGRTPKAGRLAQIKLFRTRTAVLTKQAELRKAWAALRELELGSPAHTKQMARIKKLQQKLDKLLVQIRSLTRSREPVPATEFKGYQMKWDKIDPAAVGPKDAWGKSKSALDQLMADTKRQATLKQISAEVRQKELAKLGISGLTEVRVATKVAPAAKGVHKLRLAPLFAGAKPKVGVKVKAPKVRKGKVKVKIAGKPAVTIDVSRLKTAKPTFREPVPYTVAWYAVRTIEEVTGKPMGDVSVKTAQEINATFQEALQSALRTATDTYNQGVTQGLPKGAILTNVEGATETALKTLTKTITQVKLKEAIKTKVATMVSELFRKSSKLRLRFLIPFALPKGKPAKPDLEKYRGAMAFQMGELTHGKVWHVINSDGEKITLYEIHVGGAPPPPAVVVKGYKRALETLREKGRLPKDFDIDIGIVDLTKRGKTYKFRADPKGRTTGDVSAKRATTLSTMR